MTGLGVAGVGWLGESLIKDLPHVPDLRLVAVQDARLDLAREVARRYACPWAGHSFDDLLVRPDVEAVVICTPNALHVPQAQAALRAGKHVLVQKPLALSASDAAATVALAGQTDRLLFVDYTYRFLDTVRLLRTASGVRAARAVFHNIYGPGPEKRWFLDPHLSGGGALVDLGVHLLDLALWLLEPRALSLEAAELDRQPIDTAAHLRLRLDGVPFQLDVSWNAPHPSTEIAFELETPGGLLRWENVQGSFFRFRTRRDDDVLLDRETTLREDTLRAFRDALARRQAPPIDVRVYELLDRAYGRASAEASH